CTREGVLGPFDYW
nr:immunoglobulin heavy chain junction region [Mus musculus]